MLLGINKIKWSNADLSKNDNKITNIGPCLFFLSKFLMEGGLIFFRPRRSPSGTKSDRGRGLFPLKPKYPPMLNLGNFVGVLSMKYSFKLKGSQNLYKNVLKL